MNDILSLRLFPHGQETGTQAAPCTMVAVTAVMPGMEHGVGKSHGV